MTSSPEERLGSVGPAQVRIGHHFHTQGPSAGRKGETPYPECVCGGQSIAMTNDGGSILRCSKCEKIFRNPLFCPQCKSMADEFRYDRPMEGRTSEAREEVGGEVIACSKCKISWSSKRT